MREILFRGKRIDNGEWVYGSSFRLNEKLNPFIMLINRGGESYEVDNDTRGLYTGLKDKNGTWIFEGDIIEYNGTKHRVVFENRFQTAYFGIVMSAMETWGFSNSVPANMMEVIGNIYDNPEMLKGEAE